MSSELTFGASPFNLQFNETHVEFDLEVPSQAGAIGVGCIDKWEYPFASNSQSVV